MAAVQDFGNTHSMWNVKHAHFFPYGRPRTITIRKNSDVSDIPFPTVQFFFSTFIWCGVEFCCWASSFVILFRRKKRKVVEARNIKRHPSANARSSDWISHCHMWLQLSDSIFGTHSLLVAGCNLLFLLHSSFFCDFIASLCLDWPSNAICLLMTK